MPTRPRPSGWLAAFAGLIGVMVTGALTSATVVSARWEVLPISLGLGLLCVWFLGTAVRRATRNLR